VKCESGEVDVPVAEICQCQARQTPFYDLFFLLFSLKKFTFEGAGKSQGPPKWIHSECMFAVLITTSTFRFSSANDIK